MQKAQVLTKGVQKAAINSLDIIDIILEDHKPLWELIAIMKDADKDLDVRKTAFEQFGPLLLAHAKPEEKALYSVFKSVDPMREEGFEGEVEHGLADQLVEEAKRTSDEDALGARIKVLAELVEHHLEEEENEIFPEFLRSSKTEQREELGQLYLQFQQEIEMEGSNDAPSEKN